MHSRNHLLLFSLILLFFTACRQDNLTHLDPASDQEPLSRAEIDQRLQNALEADDLIYWKRLDLYTRWSAAMQSDSIFALGYQPAGFSNIEGRMHQIDIESEAWADTRDRLFQIILEGERALYGAQLSLEDLLPLGPPSVLPTAAIRITNVETLERLEKMPEVRYLEPMGYYPGEVASRSGSGCGVSPNYNINPADYTNISPGAKRPWNFSHPKHNIQTAWNSTSGDGVTLVIIDTGASDNQNNLGSQFNSGASSGRSIQKYSTLYTGWWWWKTLTSPDDACGHGTQMAGLAAGPRSNDGNSVGVAYNADLISIKAVEDVVISTSNERNGVKDALVLAGSRSDVRVISMSIGTIFYSGTVADGVIYAYNQGKMIFAAAGTSTNFTNWVGVVFPATMSQTVAITGVRENTSPYQECNTCHYGSTVDFVGVMQRSESNRTSLTLALCCDQPTYVGGSSAATAMTAGIAGLVWSQDPGASRSTILQVLKDASDFYPSKSNDFGWGAIDADAAVNSPVL